MVTQVLTKTWAEVDTITDDADAGNIGKSGLTTFNGDLDTILISGYTSVGGSATNRPVSANGMLITSARTTSATAQIFISGQSTQIYFRRQEASVWQAWQEFYHTGNTQTAAFLTTPTIDGTIDIINTGRLGKAIFDIAKTIATSETAIGFHNPNGQVGSITLNGIVTTYATSSDPRLKVFEGQPIDEEINNQFDLLFSCFDTFHWKSDPDGDLVWGFDAHACIDAGLDMGVEGEGSRDLVLGEVYQEQEVDEDGVETQPELKVSPAGVDQAKAVPILLAKIEQLERRLAQLEA